MNQSRILIDRWIVDLNSLHIEVLGVIGVQHPRGNIWNVLPCVGFSRDVNLVALHGKRIHEVLPESHELGCHIVFIVYQNVSRGETSGDRLIYPDHVGQICP